MKLENFKQKVVPLPGFLFRLFRYALFCGLLIGVSIAIGMSGYCYFGGLELIDSFHMTCMILTGMGPTITMESDAAKLFSSFYALYSGVAFLTITAVFLSPFVHRILHILQVDKDN
ncbi:MAG: hypothetical protein IPO92_10330 [Saprospiraceae bacterium]|nr:hypothetical protein [Saprospiraceae bacterium]